MDLNRTLELAGLPQVLAEGKSKKLVLKPVEVTEYSESGHFEEAFSSATQAVDHAISILDSEGFKNWMKDSADNYSFDIGKYNKVLAEGQKFNKMLDELYNTLANLG